MERPKVIAGYPGWSAYVDWLESLLAKQQKQMLFMEQTMDETGALLDKATDPIEVTPAIEAQIAAAVPVDWRLPSERPGMVSDGSTAVYYELPPGACELQHLISHRNMNAQVGEIFRACYRYGQTSHSDELRDARKIKFYIDAEIARLSA
jgi:hypothetical protein